MSDTLANTGALGADPTRLIEPHAARMRATRTDMPTAARAVLQLLAHLAHGTLELHLPGARLHRMGTGAEPRVAMHLHDWSTFSDVLARGDIGLAEAWIRGAWDTPDLPGVLALLNRNRQALEAVVYGTWWGSLLHRLRHALNRNSRRGSRRNIHAHYDLGNAFYARWLDQTMNYSSAWFDGNRNQTLAQAQHAKVARALGEAGVRPGTRLLEIGCGWGAVAEAATRAGAHVTGVTLSTEQLHWARERLGAQGLDRRADLRLQDYRDIDDPPFDAIVSIEMFEAVGQAYWPVFFDTVRQRLAPGGRACLQTITIRDDLFDRYARSTDFIQQYIFPGGLLPSDERLRAAAGAAGLRVERALAFGPDYAETLRRWRSAFLEQAAELAGLGFDARFARTWDFYLAYCEAAFDTGTTDVVQYTLSRS
jgi:cyclopropane-fatty-acyl-phospholipid synthase